jgi:hypothetical protein
VCDYCGRVMSRGISFLWIFSFLIIQGCAGSVARKDLDTPSRGLLQQLDVGMSRDSVSALLGSAGASEVTTCGTKTASPWTCRIETYGWCRIYYGKMDYQWVVNNWRCAD